MMKRFNAFTLAEVLITLGIIGVVAAMTMPTLINQTNGAQYKAAFKKSLSSISQAVTMSVAQDDLSFADTYIGFGGDVSPNSTGAPTVASLLNGKMKVVNTTATDPYSSQLSFPSGVSAEIPTVNTYMYFTDGSMFAFNNSLSVGYACSYGTKICSGIIDVNGNKGPNKLVVCDTIANTKQDTVTDDKTIEKDTTACTVKTPADIYTVYYYDQTIVPSTNAGRVVLYGK